MTYFHNEVNLNLDEVLQNDGYQVNLKMISAAGCYAPQNFWT
jgi:hypothetical protein